MGETVTLSATAIVASENPFHRSGPLWSLEDVEIVRPLHDHELLIKMVATGICHTDIAATSLPAGQLNIHYPKIVGHEGMSPDGNVLR
jgi:Zn-dependent alcohol dehydrogenase